MSENPPRPFRDPRKLVACLKVGLVLDLLLGLLGMWFTWEQMGLLSQIIGGAEVPEATLELSDTRLGSLGIAIMVVWFSVMVLFLRWTYVTKVNAIALGARDMKHSPGWSVGYYFIPILNLFRPYQALKETFQASHPGFKENWQEAPTPGILPVWWTLWLLSSVASRLAMRTSMNAETVEELLEAARIDLWSTLLALPLTIVVLLIVTTLTSWQSAKDAGARDAMQEEAPEPEAARHA